MIPSPTAVFGIATPIVFWLCGFLAASALHRHHHTRQTCNAVWRRLSARIAHDERETHR